MTCCQRMGQRFGLLGLCGLGVLGALVWSAQAQLPPDHPILKAEAERVAVVEKVKPSVVAIFSKGGQGGGSGVLISEDGYALTNFHVVAPTGPVMQCGLADGVLYDAVLVGLDKVGDVALIKLLPKKEGQKFQFAPLGDSDLVREGDWSLAMGNPFLLATDFTPTVTFGMVSGVHRYQYPSGVLLEYTDCIQIDTSINPGNSGGPLYNMKGEIIGINGRGSFDKRARINSGVGYAISINQIKNFMGHMRSGLDTDHASLGALVQTQTEKDGIGRMVVTSILEDSDVYRRGLDIDDELVSFDGRAITSVNHFKNVLGLFPRGWRVPVEYRRERVKEGEEEGKGRKEVLVRLMGVQRKEVGTPNPNPKGGKPGKPAPKPLPNSPATKLYKAKAGFANYYFNELERDRLLASLQKHGDFTKTAGWTLNGNVRFFNNNTPTNFKLDITDDKGADGTGVTPVVRLKYETTKQVTTFEPLKIGQEPDELKQPKGSGGFLAALYVYKRLLTEGAKGFEKADHGGMEPFYPPPLDRKPPGSLKQLRVDTEVLNTRGAAYLAKWFFDRSNQQLRGFEVRIDDTEDPCEVYFSDYRQVDGRSLPHRMQVYHSDKHYGTFTFTGFQFAGK
jgi:serine protease Do